MNFGLNQWNKVFSRMLGFDVIEVMTLSGHPSIINKILLSCHLHWNFSEITMFQGSVKDGVSSNKKYKMWQFRPLQLFDYIAINLSDQLPEILKISGLYLF